jgi:hypothetical protein
MQYYCTMKFNKIHLRLSERVPLLLEVAVDTTILF